MSQFEPKDEEGGPWLMIGIGLGLFAVAWYLYTKVGVDMRLVGKAAIANSGFGKKFLIGVSTFFGGWFFIRGILKLRHPD